MGIQNKIFLTGTALLMSLTLVSSVVYLTKLNEIKGLGEIYIVAIMAFTVVFIALLMKLERVMISLANRAKDKRKRIIRKIFLMFIAKGE
ncbi:hypothetical protein [Pseudomonas fluorescens]|jgi:hypothetical protein